MQFLEQINESFLKEGSTLIKGLVEKELNSLPRGLFYWPAGKSEPLNYSYLSQRSICRVLVERLLSAKNITNPPRYLKEIFSILSHNYEKAMPPLDWCFLTAYMNFDSEYLYYTISILAKQGSLSRSAKLMLENYLTTSEWNIEKASVEY